MVKPRSLLLYEEIMLLALHDQKGTLASGYCEYALAGAVLAELLLNQRILAENTPKALVEVRSNALTHDPVLDECLAVISASKRRASLRTWVSRLAGIKNFRHKVARQLCDRGILRADIGKVLLMFKRKIYPEINPVPETEILQRLRAAIFGDNGQLDPRTVVLVSLADSADLLRGAFGRKEIKHRKKRIAQIVDGELTGKATKEIIAACQAAVIAAATLPAVIASTSSSS